MRLAGDSPLAIAKVHELVRMNSPFDFVFSDLRSANTDQSG